ncbi:unannotated protein [freshwater metagenome]|uniref:Unannotated protein n=1 Tax=freshwater metagenome TaxID=449393 RepID=A0A6J7QM06_9ZZZZ
MDAHAPIADLVAEPFDDDGAVVGYHARGVGLFVEIAQHVGRGTLVERMVALQPLKRGCRLLGAHRANELAECSTELDGTAWPVALPERHLARHARRGCGDDAFEGDVLDAPRARAEQERLAGAALIDHLFVELADAGAVGGEHTKEATVGDGAAARDRKTLGAGAAANNVGDAVPHDARTQLGELLGRVPPRQQVEGGAEHIIGELGEVRGTAHDGGESRNRPVVERAHSHDLLRQHIERVARVMRILDEAALHAIDHHCGLEQVVAVLREERALARLADLVTGASDALQTTRDRTRRFDLDDEIDQAHVDAELERTGGHDRLDLTRLELVLDDQATFARQRAVVRLDDLRQRPGFDTRPLGRELVELRREPFGQAARVDEHDGGAVRLDEIEHHRVDRRPDAAQFRRPGRALGHELA